MKGLQGIPARKVATTFQCLRKRALCVWIYKHDACSTSDSLSDVSCFGAVFVDFSSCNLYGNQGQGDFPLSIRRAYWPKNPPEKCPLFHLVPFRASPSYTYCPRCFPPRGNPGNRCNTLDFLAKVSVAGVPPALPRLPPTEKRLPRFPRIRCLFLLVVGSR